MSTVNLSSHVFVGLMVSAFVLGAAQVSAIDPAADPVVPSSEEDSQHWSYRPVRRPEVPAIRATQWVRNPIDAFVLAQLEERVDPGAACESRGSDAADLSRFARPASHDARAKGGQRRRLSTRF